VPFKSGIDSHLIFLPISPLRLPAFTAVKKFMGDSILFKNQCTIPLILFVAFSPNIASGYFGDVSYPRTVFGFKRRGVLHPHLSGATNIWLLPEPDFSRVKFLIKSGMTAVLHNVIPCPDTGSPPFA